MYLKNVEEKYEKIPLSRYDTGVWSCGVCWAGLLVVLWACFMSGGPEIGSLRVLWYYGRNTRLKVALPGHSHFHLRKDRHVHGRGSGAVLKEKHEKPFLLYPGLMGHLRKKSDSARRIPLGPPAPPRGRGFRRI
jgi:hypothetical protein